MIEINELLYQQLFAIAYKMTGEIASSKDICQDAISKFLSPQLNKFNIINQQAYLIKITVNTAIDYLSRTSKEREKYIGTWLPEPILNSENFIHSSIDIDYGITVVLSQLNPNERAIFILKESFDYSYVELSEILNLSVVNCRKIYQRLQEKIQLPKEESVVLLADKMRLINAFVLASQTGQVQELIYVLKEDISLYSDGGGKATAAKNILYGLEVCAKFLQGIYSKNAANIRIEMGMSNQEPSLLIYENNVLATIGLIEVTQGQISRFYFVRNPDKIHVS